MQILNTSHNNAQVQNKQKIKNIMTHQRQIKINQKKDNLNTKKTHQRQIKTNQKKIVKRKKVPLHLNPNQREQQTRHIPQRQTDETTVTDA